jgi:CheY-like chemotaxis protein
MAPALGGYCNPAPGKERRMAERKRVLVVDDEPDVLLLCRVNLEFEGYEVTEASDGVQAMERVRERRPDIILLDVMMPRMDGWQVLTELKSDPEFQDIPVVMLTAKVQDQDQIRGWTSGAAEYITKPFSPLSLSQVLEDVLSHDAAEEERRRKLVLEKLQLLQHDAADTPTP